MAVTFVIGRAGTGKTRRCIRSIVEAARADPLGPAIVWLLPKQATFAGERELACNTELGGTLRARVLSFEQLGHEILSEYGGVSVPEVTPIGRQMLLGHLLRRHTSELKFFRGVARQPGLAAQLDETFKEFERAGKDAAELDQLLGGLANGSADGDALLDKVHDLQLIYRAYKTFLGQERLDQQRRLIQMLGCVQHSRQFRDASIYCDGFRDFSEFERRMLAGLGKHCRRVEISLTMDPRSPVLREMDVLPDEHSVFHPLEMAYRRLRLVFREEQVPVDDPPVVLGEPHRFRMPALRHVEKHVFGPSILHVSRSGEGLELLDAPDRAAEADAAARRIIDLLADGCRLRDIAVLTRDLSLYADLIALSFREHRLPYFTDRRRTMSHHPLLRFIRSMLAVARSTWPHEAMMDLLKTDLAGLPGARADALENYVLRHRIRGEAWASEEPWTYGEPELLAAEEQDTAVAAEASQSAEVDQDRRQVVSRLKPFIRQFRAGGAVREVVAALFETLEAFGVRGQLATWVDAASESRELEEMAEDEQVWTEVVKLFDEMVELLGDETVDAGTFTDVLESGLEQFDLALTPPTVDEVLVGQVDRTRALGVRAVLVLGVNEGIFPHLPREDTVLSDSDRRFFGEHQLDVSPTASRRLMDEDLLGYIAFTLPSELLYVSHARADAGGRTVGPSRFFARLAKMFPTARRTSVPREVADDPRWVGTPRQLIASLSRWVRENPEGGDMVPLASSQSQIPEPLTPALSPEYRGEGGMPWPSLFQWHTTQRNDPSYTGWRALSYHNDAAVSREVAGQLFTNPLRATAGELETFAACPFRHFLKYGLGLQPREEEDDVSALDMGNVYHHLLERIVAELLKRRQNWADLSDAERDRLIHLAAEQIGQKLRGEILLSTARNRYLLHRIERTLGQVVQTHKAGAARGNMTPAFARLRFGEGEDLPELTIPTPRGAEVRLGGKIDRVDLDDASGQAAVVDYRLGDHKLPLADVYHGLALQLLTYLLVLEAHGEALAGRKLTPAAAFYVRMLRRLGDVEHPADALSLDDPLFHLKAKPRGLVVEDVVRTIDTSLTEGASSDVIQCQLKKDGTFGSKLRSDLASADEFAALLAHVRRRMGELADEILAGEIGVRPYLLGQTSPCPQCDYRAVCRFHPADGYHFLASMNREDVLLRVLEPREGASGG